MLRRMVETARLITVSFSHYCEKARWGLERAGVPFREEPHLPMFHMVATRRVRARRTVPALVTGGRVLPDSSDILAHADGGSGLLYPTDAALREEVLALEDRFDEVLGPHTRRLAYHYALDDRKVALDLVRAEGPLWQRRLIGPLFPLVKAVMKRAMRIDDAGVERSRRRIDEVFADVSTRLDGRRFLVGDRFTAADLTFAALAAPVIVPDGYGARLPRIDEVSHAFQDTIGRLRATVAGQYALRMYATERRRQATAPPP